MATKKKKKPAAKKESPVMLPPIAFDKADENSLETVGKALWVRGANDAFVQCLRLATEAIAKQPSVYRRHRRDLPVQQRDKESGQFGASSQDGGRLKVIRLFASERAALDELREACHCDSTAEAMRLTVRIAEHWISK